MRVRLSAHPHMTARMGTRLYFDDLPDDHHPQDVDQRMTGSALQPTCGTLGVRREAVRSDIGQREEDVRLARNQPQLSDCAIDQGLPI